MQESLRHTDNLTWVWVIFLGYWFVSALKYYWSQNRKQEKEIKDDKVYRLLWLVIPRTFHLIPLVIGFTLWTAYIHQIPFSLWGTLTVLGYTFLFVFFHYLFVLLFVWSSNSSFSVEMVLDFHRKARGFLAIIVTTFFAMQHLVIQERSFFEEIFLFLTISLFVLYVGYYSIRIIRFQSVSILTVFLYNCTFQILPIFLWVKFTTDYLVQ